MEFDAFTEGIEPGGLRSRSEIGILICYLLDYIDNPFPKDDLIEIFQENGLANYFETVNAISELIKHDNVAYTDDVKRCLSLTDNGKMISAQLNGTLSLTTRQKATTAASQLIQRRKVEQENPVTITREEGGGYQVNMKITDGIRDLMSLTVFVPDIREANAVKKNFHKNPERLYSITLAAVIGDKNMIRNALEAL